MGAERDIVARTSCGGQNSAGALAAYLARSCGHVWLDARVLVQAYRFYPWMSDEIPHFFNKRFSIGSGGVAITLQAGLAVDGDDPFEDCQSNADARKLLESPDYQSSLWLAKVTVGMSLLDVEAVSDPLFIAKHPAEFRLLADELVAVGLVQASSCPMCSDDQD